MSTVIRRFISYVGKVKLTDFKNSTHMTLVDKYCNEQESRVSYFPLRFSEFILPVHGRIPVSNKPQSRELSSTNLTRTLATP